MRNSIGLLVSIIIISSACAQNQNHEKQDQNVVAKPAAGKIEKINLSEQEWKERLSDQEFYVLRKEGTERAFANNYWDNKQKGTYVCGGCQLPLFSSETKYESGTGWPSFYKPLESKYVAEVKDRSLGVVRTEVECARCGGHLGHVFDDGPEPTGLRYCLNSAALDFVPAK